MTRDFLQTLLEVRKDFDIFPYMEIVQAQMPKPQSGGVVPAGTQALFALVPPYPLMFPELPFVAWDVSDPATGAIGDLSIGGGTYNWSTGNAPEQFQQAQVPLTTEQILGAYNDRWVRSRGVPLNKYEQWNGQFVLGNRYNNGAGLLGSGQLYTGLRGYQLYKKGSIGDPPQLTREELLADGKTQLMPYSFSAIVTVTFKVGSSQQYSTQLKLTPPSGFDADFMVHSLRVAPADVPKLVDDGIGVQNNYIYSYIPAVLVGVQPAQRQLSFQGGTFGTQTIAMAPWQMYYGRDYSLTAWGLTQTPPVWLPPTSRLDTGWKFPVPCTFKKNEQINLFAQPLALNIKTLGAYTMPMEFVFDGELVIRG